MVFRVEIQHEGRRYRKRIALMAGQLPAEVQWEGPPCRLVSGWAEGRMSLIILADDDIEIERVSAYFERIPAEGGRVFMNGYQSWTDSREFYPWERMRGLGMLGRLGRRKYLFDRYGDYNFVKGSSRRGCFHGFSYTYFAEEDRLDLFASLDEDSAFTIFQWNTAKRALRAERDCKGRLLKAGETFQAFSLAEYRGTEAAVFDAWFGDLGTMKPSAKPLAGWTSWYDHYEKINEGIILDNLAGFRKVSPGERIIQIDDGYQTAVGDWLSIDRNKFPGGLAPIADSIHAEGFRAGLWLAPFAAQKGSKISREHPEWLLRDEAGWAIEGGSNWGGFWALDIRQVGLREYLRVVFDTILRIWGFDLVKLDFLYAACLRSFPEATRAELMAHAMRFLREIAGDKLILGCGVPLASAFGRVDYCRVGCDIGLDWEEPWWMRSLHRERISTVRTIRNSLGRRQLDGRAFLNDPDVFILRSERNSLTPAQRKLLFFINSLFGSLVFTSDNVGEYGPEAAGLFGELDRALARNCISVREHQAGAVVEVVYLDGTENKWTALNLSSRRREIDPVLGPARGRIFLKPFGIVVGQE